MKRSQRKFAYGILESLARIEEISSSTSFFLSKIFELETSLGKRSKYAVISRQLVFLAIIRSNTLVSEIMRSVDIAEQNGIFAASWMKR